MSIVLALLRSEHIRQERQSSRARSEGVLKDPSRFCVSPLVHLVECERLITISCQLRAQGLQYDENEKAWSMREMTME